MERESNRLLPGVVVVRRPGTIAGTLDLPCLKEPPTAATDAIQDHERPDTKHAEKEEAGNEKVVERCTLEPRHVQVQQFS